MRIIELTKVPTERSDRYRDQYNDSDDTTEGHAPETADRHVSVNVESIRCFYPRRENKPGTRITFKDGGGFAVAESYDDVKTKVSPN